MHHKYAPVFFSCQQNSADFFKILHADRLSVGFWHEKAPIFGSGLCVTLLAQESARFRCARALTALRFVPAKLACAYDGLAAVRADMLHSLTQRRRADSAHPLAGEWLQRVSGHGVGRFHADFLDISLRHSLQVTSLSVPEFMPSSVRDIRPHSVVVSVADTPNLSI
jgi:hypothetical protein